MRLYKVYIIIIISKNFMVSNIFSSKIVPFFEVKSKQVVDPERLQMTIKHGSCELHAE